MGYTLGQAAKAVGMSKTSILRSIKAGRISAGRDEFGQWAIEPCELHRVYPALTDDNETGNGTGERAVTGGDTALVGANARASLLEWRINDLRTMLDDMRGQRDDMRGQRDDMRNERDHWREQAQRLALADQRERTAAVAPQAKPERRGWWSRLAG
jgi:hypothetical protein